MNKTEMKKILFSFLLLVCVGCEEKADLAQLRSFAPTESYPDDTFLNQAENKTALVFLAHDDDDCAMAGTIALLQTLGWNVVQCSLVQHPDPNSGELPARFIYDRFTRILSDGLYRPALDTLKTPYLPIPYKEIDRQFLTEKVRAAIQAIIDKEKPSVLFTLDPVKGGYGHPEHIFISRLLQDMFLNGKTNAERLYQSVYTPHMEQEIVDKWLKARMQKWGYPHASDIANKIYGIKGMPEPNTQIDIKNVAETKMKYLMAYPSDVRKNIKKFVPYYDGVDAQTYFGIFNREFFRMFQMN